MARGRVQKYIKPVINSISNSYSYFVAYYFRIGDNELVYDKCESIKK